VGDVFAAGLRRLDPDLGVVVAYGHILRPEILAIPAKGMINVHASLLPRLRGAAPIQHAILQGDRETGISIMQMDEGLDSGPVLHHIATPIGKEETAGSLSERLAGLGASALVEALSLLSGGLARPQPQNHARATYAPKLDREMARVPWDREAAGVARHIRAFDPAPGAWTTLDGSPIKLFGAREAPGTGEPGQVLEAGERLVIATGTGAIEVDAVQPAGKPRMPVADWVRGRGIRAEHRLR
jgi:methionyl-tRNA formyltransferase